MVMRSALLALLLLAPVAARAAQALVVVSEPLTPSFREALDGFLAEWGEPVDTASAGRALPPGSRAVVVAFGGRAAARARRDGTPMIVALAPGYRDEGRAAATVRVAMTPSPERFISALAAAGVRRLLAVREVAADPDFLKRAAAAGERAGVRVDEGILSSPDGLPHLLRHDGVLADAVWLAPDPGTVNPENFGAAREFARARSLPFFAPAAGLVMDEVRGDLTVSFRECGREAARAARELLAGRVTTKVVYPPAAGDITAVLKSTSPSASR
ncbi:MAG: hypothetical protein HYX59_08370 [Elusimicrobia bacterium]|nr:hypothetical protein [Elusimicrobiota bacterium]